ncbi:MAG: hypothetical protein ACR2QU_09575, partial [Gammaproteobacteria bacterium]
KIAERNPALIEELTASSNPARFAYQTALAYDQAQELKDVSAYRERIEAEVRAKIMAEIKGEQDAKAEKKAEKEDALKPSLAQAGDSGLATPEPADDLEDLMGSDANHRKR